MDGGTRPARPRVDDVPDVAGVVRRRRDDAAIVAVARGASHDRTRSGIAVAPIAVGDEYSWTAW